MNAADLDKAVNGDKGQAEKLLKNKKNNYA